MGQALRRDQGGGDTRAPAPAPANGEDATPTRALAKRDEAISHRKPEGEGGGQADCPKGRVCPDGIL